MLLSIFIFVLAAGIPYYSVLESNNKVKSETIFLISSFFLAIAIVASVFIEVEFSSMILWVALISSLYSIYKATKTTNFYKLGYYLIFINAPYFILFIGKQGLLYSTSLLVVLFGIYTIAKHYERHYGSANYHSISGTTLETPYAGSFLTLYLISIALYPPFPNSIFLFNSMIQGDTTLLWYLVVIIIFFGNFIISMRVMPKTVFGKANPGLHYVDLGIKSKIINFTILIILTVLSIIAFKEAIIWVY